MGGPRGDPPEVPRKVTGAAPPKDEILINFRAFVFFFGLLGIIFQFVEIRLFSVLVNWLSMGLFRIRSSWCSHEWRIRFLQLTWNRIGRRSFSLLSEFMLWCIRFRFLNSSFFGAAPVQGKVWSLYQAPNV